MGHYHVVPTSELHVREWLAAHIHEFGYDIIESGDAFPDYILADAKGRKLRTEVEFDSLSFLRHRHNPEGCDLVLCWIHNARLPVRVLELSRRRYHHAFSPPRRRKKEVSLFLKKGSPYWYIRFDVLPEEIRYIDTSKFPGRPKLKLNKCNRVALSLKTYYKTTARHYAAFIARELRRARQRRLMALAAKVTSARPNENHRPVPVEIEWIGEVCQVTKEGLLCVAKRFEPEMLQASFHEALSSMWFFFARNDTVEKLVRGDFFHLKAFREGDYFWTGKGMSPRTLEKWVFCGKPTVTWQGNTPSIEQRSAPSSIDSPHQLSDGSGEAR